VQSPYVPRGGADVDEMTFSRPSEESVTGHMFAPALCLLIYNKSLQPHMLKSLFYNKGDRQILLWCINSTEDVAVIPNLILHYKQSNSNRPACAAAYILLVNRAEIVPLASQRSKRKPWSPEGIYQYLV